MIVRRMICIQKFLVPSAIHKKTVRIRMSNAKYNITEMRQEYLYRISSNVKDFYDTGICELRMFISNEQTEFFLIIKYSTSRQKKGEKEK